MKIHTFSYSLDLNGSLTWRDVLDSDLVEYVPRHWLDFEPPSKFNHYLLASLYIFILIPGLLANGSIVFLYFRCKQLQIPSNLLVLSLSLADLLINLKMPIFIYNSFMCGPALGRVGCNVYGFFGGLSGTAAIMSITAMAVERFQTINNPLKHIKMTQRKARYIVASIWAYSCLFALPPALGLFNRYVPEGYLTSCSFDYLSTDTESRAYIFTFFVAAFCVPMVAIAWSYIGIVVAVRRSELSFVKIEPGNARNIKGRQNMEIKIAKVAFCLISLWVISWAPYAAVALIGIFYDQSLLTPAVSMVPALFAKTSSVLNPFIYALTHPQFKKEVRRTFLPWTVKREVSLMTFSYKNHMVRPASGSVKDESM